MLELIQAIPFAFGALFPVVNPIGSSVIFLSMVQGSSHQEIKHLAFRVALYTAILLTTVLVVGSWILRLFGITIPIVLIGGGLVLAYIGWQLLNQPEASSTQTINPADRDTNVARMAFYPLTMPVTSGPGCIAVAMALGAHSIASGTADWQASALGLAGDAIGITLVACLVLFCYRYADAITTKLGASGTQVIMRLAAFINLCIGLELMWHGTKLLIPALA